MNVDCFIPVSYCVTSLAELVWPTPMLLSWALVLISPSLVRAVLYTFFTLLTSGNRVGVKTDGQTFRVYVDIGSKTRWRYAVTRHIIHVPSYLPLIASDVVSLGGGQPALGYVMVTWQRLTTGVCSRAAALCMVKFRPLLSFVPWFGERVWWETNELMIVDLSELQWSSASNE